MIVLSDTLEDEDDDIAFISASHPIAGPSRPRQRSGSPGPNNKTMLISRELIIVSDDLEDDESLEGIGDVLRGLVQRQGGSTATAHAVADNRLVRIANGNDADCSARVCCAGDNRWSIKAASKFFCGFHHASRHRAERGFSPSVACRAGADTKSSTESGSSDEGRERRVEGERKGGQADGEASCQGAHTAQL